MVKWLLAVLALLIAVLSAAVVFAITGVIEPQSYLLQTVRSMDWAEPYIETYETGRIAQEWRREEEEQLLAAWGEVEAAREELQRERAALDQRQEVVAREEERLDDRLAAARNVQRLAELYTDMAPQEAVEILKLMEEALVAEILLTMASEDASIIMASMPPELAASLSRQLQ